MIEEATKNARSSAEKFAKDSDSELGKIKRANQGQFIIEDRGCEHAVYKKCACRDNCRLLFGRLRFNGKKPGRTLYASGFT